MRRRTADRLCSKCPDPGFKLWGGRWLCVWHYRADQMRNTARLRGRAVPSFEELERLRWRLIARRMKCEHCKVRMNWLARDGRRTTVTLQHDRSGELRFICYSCNSIHGTFPGDTFYRHPPGTKWCPICKTAKPLAAFFAPAKRAKKCKATSYCRVCRAEIQRRGYKTTRGNQ